MSHDAASPSPSPSTSTSWRDTDPGLVDRLLHGAVDLHCHSGPSVMPRYFDHYEAMQEASAAGIRALLVKDHYYSAAPVTAVLNKHFAHFNVRMLSGVPLNSQSGGLNIYAVEHGLKLGARLVWMPTFASANHINHHKQDEHFTDKFPQTKKKMLDPVPLTILDGAGRLVPEVGPILDLIAEHDAVLSSGHLHVSEISRCSTRPRVAAWRGDSATIPPTSWTPRSTTFGAWSRWASTSSTRCACSSKARASSSSTRPRYRRSSRRARWNARS